MAFELGVDCADTQKRRNLPPATRPGSPPSACSCRTLSHPERRLREATIDVPNPDIEGLREHHCEVIDHKVTWKLAQRLGSYVVRKSCAR